MTHRDRLLRLLLERSFRLGDFVLTSGARSRYYVDARTTTTHAEGQFLIGELGLALLRSVGLRPDAVGGLTMGADPMACAIAHASWRAREKGEGEGEGMDDGGAGEPIHAFTVRKEPKAHGAGRRIEGCFAAGSRVVVVEDVITSGGSALRACEAVEAEGGEVLAVLALVDREEGGRAAIVEKGYPVWALLRVSELLAAAGEGGGGEGAEGAASPETG